tara:strand:- start:10677 stop:11021 length:345 start_codon:yes stop_codon:yes gene_type:complete
MSTLLMSGVKPTEAVVLLADSYSTLDRKPVCVISVLESEGKNMHFAITRLSDVVRAVALIHDAIVHAGKMSIAFAVPTHWDAKLRAHDTKLRKAIASVHFRWVLHIITNGVLVP